ncbi:MAG TPA: hypothetical protein VI895_10875 [Bdellovibrionota bacterium]|nr:hypothetical protein [Bdellovibrionota bacterium]
MERLSPVVAELRELKFRKPVEAGKRSKEQIQAYIESRIAEEYKDQEIEYERRTLVLLGLMDASFPYRQSLIGLMREQVAGYYDPTAKSLYLADWVSGTDSDPIFVHELTHALQDQHFELKKFMKRNMDDDDRTLAVNSLLEGDAFSVMMDFSLKGQSARMTDLPDMTAALEQSLASQKLAETGFKDIPQILLAGVLFPYVRGSAFIRHLRMNGGWKSVDEAFRKLPASSEQILHPAKFLARNDPPIEISKTLLDGKLPPGSNVLMSNVLGEFGWHIVLGAKNGSIPNGSAGAGWGGDRFWLIELNSPKKDALLLASVWDSEKDAQTFEADWKKRGAAAPKVFLRDGKKALIGINLVESDVRKSAGSWFTY